LFKTTLICTHAPTEEKDEIEKNTFYDKLDRVYQVASKYESKSRKYLRICNVGRHRLHEESNGNGLRLMDFTIRRNMFVSSTRFPHKDMHKETWISPDGQTKNQTDHVLNNARHAYGITDVRSCRSADCDSDHHMVKLKYRSGLVIANMYIGVRNKKFDVGRVKDRNFIDEYREIAQELENQFPQSSNGTEEKRKALKAEHQHSS
jgi:hypothetical protein